MIRLIARQPELAPALLEREATAIHARRTINRLCLLWPELRSTFHALADHIGNEIGDPPVRPSRNLYRAHLKTVQSLAQDYTSDRELWEDIMRALKTTCRQVAELSVATQSGIPWSPADLSWRAWRPKNPGTLVIVRHDKPRDARAAAKVLYKNVLKDAVSVYSAQCGDRTHGS